MAPLTGGAVGVVGSAGERVGWFGQTCDGLAGSFIFLLILETCDGLEMAKWGNVSIRIRGFLSQKIIFKSFNTIRLNKTGLDLCSGLRRPCGTATTIRAITDQCNFPPYRFVLSRGAVLA